MVDPTIRSRNIGNKRRGANWEITLVNWFREKMYDSERTSKKGTRDEGDLTVKVDPGHYLIVEAKNAQRFNLADWLRQAREQAERWTTDRPGKFGWPVVIIKRRNQPVEKAYVVMELDRFLDLLG